MKKDEYWLKDYNNIHSVCEKAIFTYGAEHQQVKAIEEMGELINALSNSLIGITHNVEEEFADVEIMICQLKKMFQVEYSEFGTIRNTSKTDQVIAMGSLGKLIQDLSRAIIGESHNIEDRIIKVQLALHRIRNQFDVDLIEDFKYKKLERLAKHIW